MTQIEEFIFERSDEDIYYFNYKSAPNQIIELDRICSSCEEDISNNSLDEGQECPECEEEIYYTSIEAYEFFETDLEDDEIAGFAYQTHNHNRAECKATITLQGIVNFDTKVARIVEYDNDGIGRLSKEKSLEDVGIYGNTTISEVKRRLDLFTSEWGIDWEIDDLFDNELNKVD